MSAESTNPSIAAPSTAAAPLGGTTGGSATSQLLAQLHAMPRALRWSLAAALALGLYALFNVTTWEWARQATAAADALQTELDKANRRPLVDPRLRGVVLAYGPIRLPPSEDEGALGLADAVNEVLKKHREADKVNDQGQAAGRLQGTGLTLFMPPGSKAARVSRDLEFRAPPHVASAIIRDLEAHPAVDGISRLEMRADKKGKDPNLEVKLTVEAWVAGDDRSRRGGA